MSSQTAARWVIRQIHGEQEYLLQALSVLDRLGYVKAHLSGLHSGHSLFLEVTALNSLLRPCHVEFSANAPRE